uniref:Uncharacterized protein n=1 Tax=Panagrolaimus sp. ES5 TaxID=591445 RepID=A0AC34G3Q4_9BILA
MIQSCKYFFIKNPIIHLHCLWVDEDADGEWKTCIHRSCLRPILNREYREIDLDLDQIHSKIWIDSSLIISSSNPSTFTSSIFSKLYNSDVKNFQLFNQSISFNQFLSIAQNVETCHFEKNTVKYENGAEVPCEVILANFPKLKDFIYNHPTNTFYDYSTTAKELLQLPHFKNLELVVFPALSQSFDIDSFFSYIKKNDTTSFALGFVGDLSVEYKEKLQAITDEILNAELPRAYKPPYITFDGQLRENQLRDLYWKTCIHRSCLRPILSRKYREIDLDLDQIHSKIWIDSSLIISSSHPSTFTSSIFSKLYNSDVKNFQLFNQSISFNQFLSIAQNVETCHFEKNTVKYENGAEVPCEVILANFPKLKDFIYNCPPNIFYDYSTTAKELLQLPHFINLELVVFPALSQSFDIDLFFSYIKKNDTTSFALGFVGDLSVEYKEKLQAITDEILNAELPRAYKPPYITFDGQLRQNQLRDLYVKYF